MQKIEGNIVDILNRKIYPGEILIDNGKILAIHRNSKMYEHFICPGFIDAHVHIESSMLIPENFSEVVIRKGTVAVVNDPHEIANVAGIDGITFIIENSRHAAVKIFFTIPSCVPATPLDSSGSIISSSNVEELATTGNFIGLSEVMNVPGVIHEDTEVVAKLNIAKRYGLKIDGHAPGLSGEALKKYVSWGISTDHESSTLQEAEEKIKCGMKILIREGSAAKNYEALKSLIKTNPEDVMFCTDDSHPDELMLSGHIDKIVKRAVGDGFDLFDVLKIAAINPVKHYQMDVGMLRPGDSADFIIIQNLGSFKVLATYINGIKKYDLKSGTDKREILSDNLIQKSSLINKFNHDLIAPDSIKRHIKGEITIIKVINGELFTPRSKYIVSNPSSNFESNINDDILKIVYLNRYQNNSKPQVAYIEGFCLKEGAFASSISHDSHNIIAVGCCDKDITDCINAVITAKGGLCVKQKQQISLLPLPIGGIMTYEIAEKVDIEYTKLNFLLKKMGCKLDAPFMTLSFMSLIVIPELKIGEKGLFDFKSFDWIDTCGE